MHQDIVVAIDQGSLMRVALALALGLLVGVQRGWAQRQDAPGTRFAGIRTYGLFGLAGGMAGVAEPRSITFSLVLLAGTAVLVLLGYWRTSRAGADNASGTASIVALLTLGCGYLAGTGATAPSAAIAGSIVLVLAMRAPLHRLIRSLDEREVMAIGRFALIALVILPLLPNTPFGPYGAWRPRALWLVVVFVSGFSFAGYLAAKWLGASRGMLAMAATGSLVSSTAVTASMASRHRAGEGDPHLLNAAIALASAVMFVRVMVLTAALAPFALPTLALAAVPGMLVSLAAALWLRRHSETDQAGTGQPMKLRNPFDIGPALVMMALVMALTGIAHWVLAQYGDRGLAAVLAITGVVDVDSAIITMGSLPRGTLPDHTAGLVLLPPILLNTLFKAGVAGSVGGWRRAGAGVATLVASACAALAGAALTLA